MRVLVDTSVWSLALRRKSTAPDELLRLIELNEVVIIGAIRQELLSGIREQAQFENLRDYLDAFPDFPLRQFHFVEAARIGNACRKAGIQASSIDYLIASVSMLEEFPLYTTDQDFRHMSQVVPLVLFKE